jgi:drug/metabolite transporter (DMT)-like permease
MSSAARTVNRVERRLTVPVIIAIVVTVIAWASAFVVIRGTYEHISGGALALGRLAVGAVFLTIPLLVARKWVRPNGREWLLILGFGIVWFGIYNVALNIAESTVDAGTTSMIVNIGPILIALGSGLFLREKVSGWVFFGALVAFSGVVLIAVDSGALALTDPGVLWCLLAAFAYAGGVLFQKIVLRRIPAAQVTWLGCVIGLVACLPFAPQLVTEVSTAPLPAILGVVYLGVVPTALAFSTWAYALQRMPASQLGVSTYVVPPLVVLMALVFFQEVPTWLAILGGVICLVGVAVARRRPRAPLAGAPGLVEQDAVPAPRKSLAE